MYCYFQLSCVGWALMAVNILIFLDHPQAYLDQQNCYQIQAKILEDIHCVRKLIKNFIEFRILLFSRIFSIYSVKCPKVREAVKNYLADFFH